MAENHAIHLGKLVGNLQSLEVLLRFYHKKIQAKKDPASVYSSDYWELKVGDAIAEDAFSNYDTLGKLVSKFNSQITSRDHSLVVDPAVIDVRDLLAHGRVSAKAADPAELKIIKFGSPSGGKVAVVASSLMSEAWFETNISLVRAQIEKVANAIEKYTA